MQGGSPTSHGDGGVANLAGSTGCRRDRRSKDRHGLGNEKPQEQTLGIGDPGCCRGEALQSRRSGHTGGAIGKNGRRGGLVGVIPRALCGEAPKGQPMIRGESLKAVCVEAPQGQPRIHRRGPSQRRNTPPREEEKKSPKRREGPPSSPSMEREMIKNGGRSREQTHGKRGLSGKTCVERRKSSSKRTGREQRSA